MKINELPGVRTPATLCPFCGYKIDGAHCVDSPGAMPKPGDLSLCFGCGEVLVFNQELKQEAAKLSDLMRLNETQQRMMSAAQREIRCRPKNYQS